MYCCIECGHIFDEDEVLVWKENRGEWWGEPCYEKMSGCPQCKGNYVETYKCDHCNEWITDDYIKTVDNKRFCQECYMPMTLGEE